MINKCSNIKGILTRQATFLMILIFLSGCASSDPVASTESVAVHATEAVETPEDSSADDLEESTETSTESSTPVSYITGSKTLEALVSALWGRMLRSCAVPQINMNDYEDWDLARKVIMQRHIDDEYEIEVFLAKIGAFQGSLSIVYAFYEDYCQSLDWRWNEFDENNKPLTVTSALYPEAEKYWEYGEGDDLPHYTENEVMAERISYAKLKVSGTVKKVSYENGKRWFGEMTTETGLMWANVLREAGNLYLKQNGTVLGQLKGQAYMMAFDIDTSTGTFWICPDGSDPVKMVFVFDLACFRYETQIIEDAVFTETEKENAWLSMEYDLVTEHLKE